MRLIVVALFNAKTVSRNISGVITGVLGHFGLTLVSASVNANNLAIVCTKDSTSKPPPGGVSLGNDVRLHVILTWYSR
jgi:hypothetical protein